MKLSSRLGKSALMAGLAGSLVMTALAAAHASPGLSQVGLVSGVEATQTSITLEWWPVSGAAEYEVDMASDINLTDRRQVRTVSSTRTTLTGLRPGEDYCFNVRAVNRSNEGLRSRRYCKSTISAQGTGEGARFKVLTYNLCSRPCGGWKKRRPAARKTIMTADADVVALQETKRKARLKLTGYKAAVYTSAKWLYYKENRFSVRRSGSIDLGREPGATKNRWAVWAELADNQNNGRRAIFVSVHTAPGEDRAGYDAVRAANTDRLLAGVAKANAEKLPVIYAGDMNSHKHRQYDSVTAKFKQAGYTDAFELAERFTRPNYNSANKKSLQPKLGYTYGDHVDRVFVDAPKTRVRSWANAALMDGSRYAAPLPSDHNPVLVDLVID